MESAGVIDRDKERVPAAAPYIARFEQLGFGMFVHFGLYSLLGRGEWVRELEKIPAEKYEPLAGQFAPGDMGEIVKVAKAAGCRYITLTTRHHDGFSLYDTRGIRNADGFDALHTPAGRDLVAEFVARCRENDILPFFYHTTLDWHRPEFNDDFPAYLEYLRDSVEQLCRNYGPIGGFWFDGNWSRPDADWQEAELYGLIRRLQPKAMIINNTGLGARGAAGREEIDAVTYERGMPGPVDRRGQAKYVAGEMCETLCDHWGKAAEDINFKSVARLIGELCECRKVGANFLLNVGPDADGTVDTMQRGTMGCIGRWMRVYGKAIYNGRPFLIYPDKRDFMLRDAADPHLAYLFRFSTRCFVEVDAGTDPESKIVLERMPAAVNSVRWLDSADNTPFVQRGDVLELDAAPFPYGRSYPVRVAEVEFAR